MRRQHVIGIDHHHVGVCGEVAAPRIVLLWMTDDEPTTMDVQIDRRPAAGLFGRVVNRRRRVPVARRDRRGGGAAGDLQKSDTRFGGGVDQRCECARQGIGDHSGGQKGHGAPQYLATSKMALANSWGASCGTSWPIPSRTRWSYRPVNSWR